MCLVSADFGDYTLFKSQDFLREYVLFPVVSFQSFSVNMSMILLVFAAYRHTFFCAPVPPPKAYLIDRYNFPEES